MKHADQWVLREYITAKGPKKRIFEYIQQYFDETEPAERLRILRDARDLALQLNEYWLSLYLEHRRLQVLLYETGDYRAGLDEVMRVAVEARKPIYDRHPQRMCVHKDVIFVHSEIDPQGNVDLIKNALEYMASQTEPDLQCHFCLQHTKIEFELNLNHLDDALAIAENYASISNISGTKYEYQTACLSVCAVNFQQKDWNSLMRWAVESGRVADESQDYSEKWESFRVEQLAWLTLAHFHQGNENEAQKNHQLAVHKAGSRKRVLPDGYYEALCAYYEARGEPEQAVAMRQHQYSSIVDKGRNFREYKCLYEICRLLVRAGKPVNEVLSQAKLVAIKLKQPEQYFIELDKLKPNDNP
jgi:hypothetical protein